MWCAAAWYHGAVRCRAAGLDTDFPEPIVLNNSELADSLGCAWSWVTSRESRMVPMPIDQVRALASGIGTVIVIAGLRNPRRFARRECLSLAEITLGTRTGCQRRRRRPAANHTSAADDTVGVVGRARFENEARCELQNSLPSDYASRFRRDSIQLGRYHQSRRITPGAGGFVEAAEARRSPPRNPGACVRR